MGERGMGQGKKSRPGIARPSTSGTQVPDAVLQKTRRLNSQRPQSVPYESAYSGRGRKEELQGGMMTVKDRRAFKDQVLGGIGRKTTKLQPLPTNVGSESAASAAFLSERALRNKFMQERAARNKTTFRYGHYDYPVGKE